MRKKILLILLVVIAAVIGAILSIDPIVYNSYVEQQLRAAARRGGVQLTVQDLAVRWGKLRAAHVRGFFPRAFAMGTIDDLTVAPGFWSLLLLRPTLQLQGSVYGGSLNGRGSYRISQRTSNAALEIKGANLALHEQLAGAGVTSGTLDLNLSDVIFDDQGLQSGSGRIVVRDFAKPAATTIQLPMAQGRMPLTIPAILALNADAQFAVAGGALSLSALQIDSSLGSITGRATLPMNRGSHADRVDVDLEVRLADEGASVVGPLLPLLSNNRLRPESRAFRILVAGTARTPQMTFRELS